MSLTNSTYYQDLYQKWMTHLASDKPIKSFFLEGSENIREMRATYQKLGEVTAFTDWLRGMAIEECQNGGNMLQANSAYFDIIGGC